MNVSLSMGEVSDSPTKLPHCVKLTRSLLNQTNDGEFCDLELVVSDQSIMAHKCVLYKSCEYFRKAIDEIKEEKIYKVKEKAIHPKGLRLVLNWIYTGKHVFDVDDVPGMFQTLQVLELRDMQDEVVKELIKKVNPSNFDTLLSYSQIFSLDRLEVFLVNYISNNFRDILPQNEVLFLPTNILKKVLSSDHLLVDEEKFVFNFLVKWLLYDPENRLQDFPDIFKLVRLQFIQIDYLIDVVRKTPFVRESSSCRDFVEDALIYHILRDKVAAQNSRLFYRSMPDPNKQTNQEAQPRINESLKLSES